MQAGDVFENATRVCNTLKSYARVDPNELLFSIGALILAGTYNVDS